MTNSTLSTTPLCVENANVNATVFINGRSFTIAAHDDSGVMFSNAWAPSWKELNAVNATIEVDPHADVTLEPHNDAHVPTLDDAITADLANVAPNAAEKVESVRAADLPRVAYECTKHHHAKKNFDYWLLHLPKSADKLDSADFSRIRSEVESRGGWYSRKFGRIPGGFAFKNEADAKQFAEDIKPEAVDKSTVSGHVLVPYPHTDLNQADPWADKYKVDSRDFDGSQRYFISVLCNRRWGYLHNDGVVRDNAYHNHQPLGWFDTSDEAYLVLAEYLNGPNPQDSNPRIVVKSIPTPQVEPSWSTGIAVVHGNGTAIVTSNSTELATTDETESADDTPEPEQRRALFTIDRSSLTKALTRLTDTSPGNGFKTVLKSVLVSVNGTTTISASDLERYHDETLQADHDGDFDILVDAKRFKQAVSKSRKDTLQVELWDRSLRVAGTTLPSTADVDEFPHEDSLQSATHDTIAVWRGSASELASMLERTIYATDSESSRYALGGCLIEFDRATDDALQIVGTDGRRLAVSRHGKSTIDADSVESCVIAASHLKGACKALKSADDAVLSLTSDATQCNVEYVQDHNSRLTAKITTPTVTRLTTIGACGESSYVFRQVDGRFPQWRDVLPKVDTLCEVDAKALFGFATAMESATTDESRGADLTIVGNQLTATLKSDCGEFSDTLSVRGCGCDNFTATLDARFVLDFAKSVQRCGESIRIGGTDADSPMILQADNVACVIMPLARDKARK